MPTRPPLGTNILGLAIEPIDPLFFRDGRPFGASSRGASGLPTPQTLYGMLRHHVMRRLGIDGFDEHGKRGVGATHWVSRFAVRGPWLAKLSDTGAPSDSDTGAPSDVYVAAPAHLVQFGKGDASPLALLAPLMEPDLPGFDMENPCQPGTLLRPLWPVGEGSGEEPRQLSRHFLKSRGLEKVLRGEVPTREADLKAESCLFDREDRIGVGIADTGTAADGMIYSAQFLRLRPHIGFYAELGVQDGTDRAMGELLDALSDSGLVLPFGGEGRRVRVRLCEPFKWPEAPEPRDRRFATMLITPVAWTVGCHGNKEVPASRWVPPEQPGTLISAAVPHPIAVSGWGITRVEEDGRNGRASHEAPERESVPLPNAPRPTRFGVPAGTTYFWEPGKGAARERPIQAEWSFAQSPIEQRSGWGIALRCAWPREGSVS